jgi:hypothetical protein
VLFDGHSLTWTLGTNKVTASSTSPACPAVAHRIDYPKIVEAPGVELGG